MRKSKQEQSSWVRTDKLGLLGNYFESAELIRFDKIYLIFMSVCFKSFDVSHDFSKNAAPVLNCVVWVNLTIGQAYMKPNKLVFKRFKRVNDEEQLLRIFRSLHFDFFY